MIEEKQTVTYILELESPTDNKFVRERLDKLLEALQDIFIEQYPSTLINLKIDKVDLEGKK